MRIAILDRHPEFHLDDLRRQFGDVEFKPFDPRRDCREALEAWRPDAVFALKRGADPADAFRAAVNCASVRWMHLGGVGYDHLGTWDDARVTVTNSAGVLAPFHAETVIGAIFALNLNFAGYFAQKRDRVWQERGFTGLHGKSLLVVGLGRIGKCVAELAAKVGLRVSAVTRSPETGVAGAPGLARIDGIARLSEAVAEADFVSLHVPLTAETRKMVHAGTFRAMQPHAMFLNTARGGVVDQPALVEALRSGTIAAAYLDVFEEEPLPPGDPLWSLDNVILTPHMADSVSDWPQRFAVLFADNLNRRLSGEPLLNVVRPG
jgi:phosphoglycerate dehydrogenase-like enzyme